jgi:integrase
VTKGDAFRAARSRQARVACSTWAVNRLRRGDLTEAFIAPAEQRELRELARYRAKLTSLRTSAKAQIHAVMAKAAGLPVIRVHDVRHTYTSIALTAGTHPTVVADRLGHFTIGTTLDTYSHVVQSLEDQAAAQVAAVILGGPA